MKVEVTAACLSELKTVDTAVQGALIAIPDNRGSTMLNFGTVGQRVDVQGMDPVPIAGILWAWHEQGEFG